jgi:predicted nucleotidyltransferase
MIQKEIKYPTKEHETAAKKFVEIFSKDKRVMSILLVNSCARGMASRDSCLDLCVIVKEKKDTQRIWKKFEKLTSGIKEFVDLKKVGRFSHIDLNITDGKIKPKTRGWETGPDEFELEIGNIFVYSVILFDKDNYFKKVSKAYLPYYNEALRKKKLEEAKRYFINNIDHIPLFVNRGLYFAAFDRFYKAAQEFMQALFIAKKIYPISYVKWVKWQFVDVLKMPELYKEFVKIHEINSFESNEIANKAEMLRKMFEENVR